MPFYDYKCAKCAKIFEVQRGMSEKINPKCPDCQGGALQVFYAPRTMHSGASAAEPGGHSCGSCATHTCGSCGCH